MAVQQSPEMSLVPQKKLDEAVRMFSTLMGMIGETLVNEARTHDWCDTYDNAVADLTDRMRALTSGSEARHLLSGAISSFSDAASRSEEQEYEVEVSVSNVQLLNVTISVKPGDRIDDLIFKAVTDEIESYPNTYHFDTDSGSWEINDYSRIQ